MAGNGGVRVLPDNIGAELAALTPGRTQQQDGAAIVHRMGHGHEVVLAADPGNDLVILQSVGHRGTGGRDHHAGVDETRLLPLGQFQSFVTAVELVDATHTVHAKTWPLVSIQVAQKFVEA